MSRKRRRGEDGHRQNQHRRRRGRDDDKHLYVTLDDWRKGFRVYKIDMFDEDYELADMARGLIPLHRLDPPVLQLEAPAGDVFYNAMSFSALGAKLFTFMNHRCGLVYDTETAALAVGPHAPQHLVCGFITCIRVGDMLYALSRHRYERKYSFFLMSWGPTAASGGERNWSWKPLPPPPPEFTSHIAAYALHPDGRTVFITTNHASRQCTYSFDTERSAWAWHGYWALPFIGQAHFDGEGWPSL